MCGHMDVNAYLRGYVCTMFRHGATSDQCKGLQNKSSVVNQANHIEVLSDFLCPVGTHHWEVAEIPWAYLLYVQNRDDFFHMC